MSVLVDRNTKVIVQGITGSAGRFHAEQMKKYGTRLVGGVTPGKGGQSQDGVPIFDSMEEAVAATRADASVIYVPAPFAADSMLEADDAGVRVCVVITEGIPAADMAKAFAVLKARGSTMTVIGPNCPGIITPDECKIGIMPGYIHKRGHVGVISRSGTLTYEAVWQLTQRGVGQSTCLGIGGDPLIGTTHVQAMKLLNEDPDTHAIIMIGEIGGTAEEECADYVKAHVRKPVVGFIAGQTAPTGKRMGHAGAIISGGSGKASDKMKAMERAGIAVCPTPASIGDTLLQVYKPTP
ncbi:MAG TPA: succinate--CoA ligase subunit alpha [Planctomycetota bacterium]|nr:succinate--CoA ligase subunit alpha [Planctomycetota bacterium]